MFLKICNEKAHIFEINGQYIYNCVIIHYEVVFFMLSINEIGNKIKELRDFRQLSQTDVANQLTELGLSVSRETISKMETGNRNISVVELQLLSQIFNVDIDFFLEEEEEDETLVSLYRKHKELEEEDEILLQDIYMTVELIIAQKELHRRSTQKTKESVVKGMM